MARIAGVDIPRDKRVVISLTYIYGIGNTTAAQICKRAGVDENKRVYELSDEELLNIRRKVGELKVEGDLRRQQAMDIKRIMEIGSYRGMRHRRSLPVRGQRTQTNARTRKGPAKTIANKKG